MASPRTTRARARSRSRTRRRQAPTARAVRSAAERAVERVLSSEETFGLLIRRLEAAGWHVEREGHAPARRVDDDAVGLTPPARAR